MLLIDYLEKVSKEEFFQAVNELNIKDKIKDKDDLRNYLKLVDRTYSYIKILAKTNEPIDTNKRIIVVYIDLPPKSSLYILMSEYTLEELLNDYFNNGAPDKVALVEESINVMNETPLLEWLFCEVENSALNEYGEEYGTITDAGILAVAIMEMVHSLRGSTLYKL